MFFKTYTGGGFMVNNYLIACEETKKAALIDAGNFGENEIIEFCQQQGYKLEYLLLTHGHFDHISGAKTIQDKLALPIYLNKEDHFWVDMLQTQLSFYGMPPADPPNGVMDIQEGQTITLGNLKIKTIHAPGHSPGSICYYIETEKKIFVGDVIFAQSVGRTDLPGGSYDQLMNSIEQKLFTLPADVQAYSGHGPVTTIGEELEHNPFCGKNKQPSGGF